MEKGHLEQRSLPMDTLRFNRALVLALEMRLEFLDKTFGFLSEVSATLLNDFLDLPLLEATIPAGGSFLLPADNLAELFEVSFPRDGRPLLLTGAILLPAGGLPLLLASPLTADSLSFLAAEVPATELTRLLIGVSNSPTELSKASDILTL